MIRRSQRVKQVHERAAFNSSKVTKASDPTRAKPRSTSRKRLGMASGDDESGSPPRDASPPKDAGPRPGTDTTDIESSQDTTLSRTDYQGPTLKELIEESMGTKAKDFLEKLEAADKKSLFAYQELRASIPPNDESMLSVQKAWEYFVAQGANFARHNFQNIPWNSLDKTAQETLTSLSPNAEVLFKMAGGSGLMFRSWIWRIIIDNFFATKSADIEWTSPFWEAYACLERYFSEGGLPRGRPDIALKYPFWRYMTFQLHYAATFPSERKELQMGPLKLRVKPECVARIIAKALGPNFPKVLSSLSDKCFDDVAKYVALFESTLSATFISFNLVLCHPKTAEASGFAFDPDLEGYGPNAMIAENPLLGPLRGRPVDLVVEPMLVARGGRTSDDYSVPKVLWPMRVCVDWVGEFEGEFMETKDDAGGDVAAG